VLKLSRDGRNRKYAVAHYTASDLSLLGHYYFLALVQFQIISLIRNGSRDWFLNRTLSFVCCYEGKM
jgi:hypothetical protein